MRDGGKEAARGQEEEKAKEEGRRREKVTEIEREGEKDLL